MTEQELKKLLTGEENPKFTTAREETLISEFLKIFNKELASLRSENERYEKQFDDLIKENAHLAQFLDKYEELKAERQELVEALGKRIDSLKNDAKLSFYVRFEINFLQSLLSKFPEVPSTP